MLLVNSGQSELVASGSAESCRELTATTPSFFTPLPLLAQQGKGSDGRHERTNAVWIPGLLANLYDLFSARPVLRPHFPD